MKFGEALTLLNVGHAVAREGWNGKNQWLSIVDENKIDRGSETYICRAWIGIKTVDDQYVPWVASQTDILADDWKLAIQIKEPIKLDDLSKMASQEFDRVYKATKPHWTQTAKGKKIMAARKRGGK